MEKGSGEGPKSLGEGPRQSRWRQLICLGVEPKKRHRLGPTGEELWRRYALYGVKRTNDDDDADDERGVGGPRKDAAKKGEKGLMSSMGEAYYRTKINVA